MAKSKRIKKNSTPPDGYAKVEPTITKFQARLRAAQLGESKIKPQQSLWKILEINHQMSRYIYEMYYKRKLISQELYEWLLRQPYANADLIAKWKKQGYENLCCINCIVKDEKNHRNTCICRVPKATLEEEKADVECITCGCRGCASTD